VLLLQNNWTVMPRLWHFARDASVVAWSHRSSFPFQCFDDFVIAACGVGLRPGRAGEGR
jgi:hypothetical protein